MMDKTMIIILTFSIILYVSIMTWYVTYYIRNLNRVYEELVERAITTSENLHKHAEWISTIEEQIQDLINRMNREKL
jgi:transposase